MHLYFFDRDEEESFAQSESPVVPRVGELIEFTGLPDSELRGVIWIINQVHYLMPEDGLPEADGVHLYVSRVRPDMKRAVMHRDPPQDLHRKPRRMPQ